MWQGGLWGGTVWEARGVLRQAEGADEQSRAMFREAAQEYTRAGSQYAADRCLEAAASPHKGAPLPDRTQILAGQDPERLST